MQTSHDASQIPLLVGQVLQGLECTVDTGAIENQQPHATDQNDPAEKDRQGSQVLHRIAIARETPSQEAIGEYKQASRDRLQQSDHWNGSLYSTGAARATRLTKQVKRNAEHNGETAADLEEQGIIEYVTARSRVIDRAEQAHAVCQHR